MDLTKLHLHWRTSKRGDKTYKSFSLARAIWKDGKNRKEIVLKLGHLSEEEAERWRITLRALKDPSTLLATDKKNLAIISNRAYLDFVASYASERKLSLTVATPTIVFDLGMVSDDNLTLLEEAGMKYISAMDKNQIQEITKADFAKFAGMTPEIVTTEMDKQADFVKIDDHTYSKEVCVRGARRYVLCFNVQLFKDQRKAREEQLIELVSFVKEQNKELLQAKKNRGKTAT
ncbi:MAG: hypothetical protein K2Z81_02160 [Cyanobacteria bacterium]|nr:hypothetical protein [Cyanobacteriota bacterium]